MITIEHLEFVKKWQEGKLSVSVNRSLALRMLMKTSALPKRYRAAHHFWATIWFLSIPAGIGLIFYKWWAGILVLFFLTPGLSYSIKESAMQFMIDYSLESESFYKNALQTGLIAIEEK